MRAESREGSEGERRAGLEGESKPLWDGLFGLVDSLDDRIKLTHAERSPSEASERSEQSLPTLRTDAAARSKRLAHLPITLNEALHDAIGGGRVLDELDVASRGVDDGVGLNKDLARELLGCERMRVSARSLEQGGQGSGRTEDERTKLVNPLRRRRRQLRIELGRARSVTRTLPNLNLDQKLPHDLLTAFERSLAIDASERINEIARVVMNELDARNVVVDEPLRYSETSLHVRLAVLLRRRVVEFESAHASAHHDEEGVVDEILLRLLRVVAEDGRNVGVRGEVAASRGDPERRRSGEAVSA